MSEQCSDRQTQEALAAIEAHVRRARGEDVSNTPWDYQLPTANELAQMREACGLSTEELGELIGYSPHTVRQYEGGAKNPGLQYVVAALRAYRMEWPRDENGSRGVADDD